MRALVVFWLAALAIPALAAPVPQWRLARTQHFEVYAQSTDQRAQAILTWFEQLREFFEQQQGLKASSSTPIRVIVFASPEEYQPYRLRSTSDAYYVGAPGRDYIVMGSDDPAKFGLAAHEYAHLVLRTSASQLPPWLKEGLAEFFATLQITEHGTELGGALPGRVRTLQHRTWMPLADVFALTEEAQRNQERSAADLFYAESWALTEMLLLSPKYALGFQQIPASPNLDADAVTKDLHEWIDQAKLPVVQLPAVVTPPVQVEISDVPLATSRLALAQVLLAAGEFDRAEVQFNSLPDTADRSAAVGSIALHKGDSAGARLLWKKANDQGIADAQLCYNFAILADRAGLVAEDIRPVLERALVVRPDFDDAHYQLALLEKNAGHYEAALVQFQAMRVVPATRAYAYWLALADTFNELGQRDEAQAAAGHANEHASTTAEHARAAQQTYIAQTDPGVQFARDASGKLQLVTTRMPHRQANWNPFIEPGDEIHHVQGTLREIDCGALTRIRVEAAGKLLTLVIPDLKHVQVLHSPPDFVCGPQAATPVLVDYAQTVTQGIVRGIDFNPASAP